MKTIKKFLTGAFATAMTASVAYTPVLANEKSYTVEYAGTAIDALEVKTPKTYGSWKQNAKGWYYEFKNGSYLHASSPETYEVYWINDTPYCFDAAGYMVTGWFQTSTGWHFADANGEVKMAGWVKWGSNWYFFADGSMMTNAKISAASNSYYLVNDVDYKSGSVSRWKDPVGYSGSSTDYFIDKDGHMVIGWVQVGEDWYYCRPSDGSVVKGAWLQHGTKWYYLGTDGVMLKNASMNGYWLGEDGAWTNEVDGWRQNSVGWWYSDNGGYLADKWLDLDGTSYYFNKEGYMVTGWQRLPGKDGGVSWYHFASNGAMDTDWAYIDGDWYYFEDDGKLAGTKTLTSLDGRYTYELTEGKLTKTTQNF